METAIEKITPTMATKYLEMNTNNRPIGQRHVEYLAKEIKEGRWKLNGSTIVFNGDKLIDGQHRLWAVVTAGEPIQTLVVRGVAEGSFTTIDTGHQRTGGDVLHIAQYKYPIRLATAARFVMFYLTGRLFNRDRIPNSKILEFVDNNPTLVESVDFISNSKGNRLLSDAICAALHFLMAKKDKELADRLFTGILQGFGPDDGEAFTALRLKLVDCAVSKTKTDARFLAIYVIKAWNAKRKGERMKVFRYSTEEDVPKIK